MSHYGSFRQKSYKADFGQTFAVFVFDIQVCHDRISQSQLRQEFGVFANFSRTVEFSKVVLIAMHSEN